MKFIGSFNSYDNTKFIGSFNSYDNTISYDITIGSGIQEVTITDPINLEEEVGLDDMQIFFDVDPISIKCDRDDLTKRIIISQATINLISNSNLTEYLFADTNRDIPVSIEQNGDYVFSGYVDPLQFNQGYAHNYEAVTITATDPLGALEQTNINKLQNIDASSEPTIWNLIIACLKNIGLNSTNPIGNEHIDATVKNCLQNTKIHVSLFYGETEDDNKNLYDVLTEICKYFNLYISMHDGDTATIVSSINQSLDVVNLSNFENLIADDSTSIGVDDVYSQINITCNIEPVDEDIVELENEDILKSDYDGIEHYMTEYMSSYNMNESCWWGFKEIINMDDPSTWVYPHYLDMWSLKYYLRVLKNDAWDFTNGNGDNYVTYMKDGHDRMTRPQKELLTWLTGGKCRAALIAFGRGAQNQGEDIYNNRNKTETPEMEYGLLISTIGDYDNSYTAFTDWTTTIQNAAPICKYNGLKSNIFSPADTSVTNYIVISGNIILNPWSEKSGAYNKYYTPHDATWYRTFANTIENARLDFVEKDITYTEGGQFKTTKELNLFNDYELTTIAAYSGFGYYTHEYLCGVQGPQFTYHDGTHNSGLYTLHQFLDNPACKKFQYNYNQNGDSADRITKLPILACELKIGNKYCVERLDLGQAGLNKFEWLTEEEVNNINNTFYEGQNILQKSFSIGIDPKIGDFIVGTEWEIPNNESGITGMAIPITSSDLLSGRISFSIIGPYNTAWNQVSKETHTSWVFWNYTTWSNQLYSLLNNIQSILIKGLKIEAKLGSNNDKLITNADKDLVYSSAMNPQYTEKMDEDLNICTPLTLQECNTLGVKFVTSNSYILNTDNSSFWGFDDGQGGYIKPEECLIDYLYKEYHEPAKIFETTLKADTFTNGIYGNTMNDEMMHKCYTGLYPIRPIIDTEKKMQIMTYTTDLKYKTINVKFRECKTYENEQIPTQGNE